MNQLYRIDTSNLNKALIGFDRIFSDIERRFANSTNNNYPPYNVIRQGDEYIIEIAVTGFKGDEVTVNVDKDELIIKGESKVSESDVDVEYLHRGLATRAFERVFTLEQHMEVTGAEMRDGLLRIQITRKVPEELKPKTIAIEYKA